VQGCVKGCLEVCLKATSSFVFSYKARESNLLSFTKLLYHQKKNRCRLVKTQKVAFYGLMGYQGLVWFSSLQLLYLL